MRSNSASVTSSNGLLRCVQPALLTTMSSRPKAWRVAATAAAMSSARVTSHLSAIAPCPAASATCWAPCRLMSSSATRAPSAAKRIAIPAPNPEPAPVTMATLPFKRMSAAPAARDRAPYKPKDAARQSRSARRRRREPLREGVSLRLAHVEPVLGAPPQNVVGGFGPFLRPQIARFRLVEIGTEDAPEIGERGGGADQLFRPRAVEPPIMGGQTRRQPRMPGLEAGQEGGEVGVGDIAAGQRRLRCPGRRHRRKERLQPVERVFGELAEGGDLAAEDVERRRPARRVEIEYIVARHRRWIALAVVKQGADAGERLQHVLALEFVLEISIHGGDEIGDLALVRRDLLGAAGERNIGCADQRLVAVVRVDENDALVVVLHQISLRPVPELARDDVAALDQPHRATRIAAEHAADHIIDPGSAGVDDGARLDDALGAVALVLQFRAPVAVLDAGGNAGGAGEDFRAARFGVDGIERDQTRVVNPAIGIFERLDIDVLERRPLGIARQIERARRR